MTMRVGLVGAGPWAERVHGPGLAGSARTELAGVWARRPEAAGRLAQTLGVDTYPDVDALLADVDAVAFAVPPGTQAELAVRAAEAGRHLVLDKPVAADVPGAERLAAAVDAAGVHSAVFFTCRYTDRGRAFLAAAREGSWDGGRAAWVSRALIDSIFADSAWRHDRGALWDVGPHAVELVDAALGPVTSVLAASRGPHDLVQLTLAHEGGRTSQLTLSLHVPTDRSYDDVDLFGPSGSLAFSFTGLTEDEPYATLLDELTDQVDGTGDGPPCDVHRGLAVQRVLDRAEQLVAAGSRPELAL